MTNIADAPKRMPRKRAPARAVAVETYAETMAPGHVSAMAKPRKGMGGFLAPHKSTPATVKRAREDLWASLDATDPLPVVKSEAERRATRDTLIYGLFVAGFVAVVCVYVFWWSWK